MWYIYHSTNCRFSPFTRLSASAHPPNTLIQTCERNKKLGYMWVVIFSTIAIFPWQWSQIQLTLISVFSQTRYVWEKASLCPPSIKAWSLPLLNMLIHSVVPLLFLLAHETPTALLSLPKSGKRGSGITSAEAWRARASSPGWLFVV